MDASPLFDPQYLPVILATLIGFGALAALLLVPVYRFLQREEEVAKHWTPEELAERLKKKEATSNGASNETTSSDEKASSDEPASSDESNEE